MFKRTRLLWLATCTGGGYNRAVSHILNRPDSSGSRNRAFRYAGAVERSRIMRIAIDGIPLAEPKTGIGHYTFELARGLAALAPEHDFELVAHVPIEAAVEDAFDSGAALPSNLRAVHAPTNALSKRWWTIGLPLYVQRRGVALFHGTNYKVPLWNRCHTIVTIHDLSLLLHSHTHEEELVRRARLRLPATARMASKIITDSESVKREICEHLRIRPEKIAVVPLAPRRAFRPVGATVSAAARRRLGVADDFILFVGTVEPRKNLLTLVRAFEELTRSTSLRPQLVIAGKKGWLTEELFALIEQSGLGSRMLFTGYISDEDLAALYSSCRVCVYPSLYEGFGLPPLEAMSCGAPVITSRIPVIMETVGDAARLVEPTDVGALSACIRELWESEADRRRLSAEGIAHAARFTWERTARLTLDVYEEVLRGAARGERSKRGGANVDLNEAGL
ncbi:MAG TPA: glycosyltransferase family 1 protein [Pyrinomonadaceae bacterium]|nr:glycosyltransferase family 1 protein [Pyrinomonadaceae bacterium]